MQASRGENGVTLVELITTVALIGILATIAVPSFRGLIPRYKFGAAVRFLQSDLSLARLRAISRNREYRVSINKDSESYTVFEGNASDSSVTWTEKGSSRVNGADISSVESLPADNVTFNPDGTMDDEASSPDGVGRIELSNGDGSLRRRIVIMAATGRMTTERWLGTVWKDERYLKE